MSIQIGDNLSYYGKKFNFQRDAFTTLSEMKSFNENYIPEKGFKAYCAETDKYYVFSVTNEIDLETGKWREYKEILDNLESNDSTKALSANQGKLLKENIDLKEDAYNKGQPNGYAPLDSAGKVPLENTYVVTSDGANKALKIETSTYDCSNNGTTKYFSTETLAIESVPEVYRTTNRIITFLLGTESSFESITKQFISSNIADWTNSAYWIRVMVANLNGSNADILRFNPSTTKTLTNIGEIKYNSDTQTLELKCSNDVTLSIGQENYIRGKNTEVTQILNGKAVYVSGGQGANTLIKRASNNNAIGDRVIGIATQNIDPNNIGFITTNGIINEINTSALAEGDVLWLGVDGELINVKPGADVNQICIGVVLRSHATQGSLLVSVKDDWRGQVAQLRSDLNEIKDLTTIYNVTQNVPLESGYYTLATATAAAEGKGVNKDGKGIVLTYAVSDIKWESFQFTGTATDSATWNMLSLWKEFGGAGNVKTISVNDGEASFPDSEGNANIIVPITEIDEALDSQSTNPVQNKVIKEALAQMDTRFAAGMDIDTETNILSLLDAVGNVLGTAQLPSGGGGTTAPGEEVDGSTLGGLTNVNEEVDVQDAQDVFLVKSAGSDKWGKRNLKDFTGKDGVIAYPAMFLNPLTGRLTLQIPTNNYENRFAVRNGHLMLIQ